MFGMAMDSAKLFFAGKLFQDYKVVFRQILIGAGCGVIAMVVASQFLPIFIATAIGGALAGAMQPILFKNLKYA